MTLKIDSVSMEYFFRGVEAAKPLAPQQGGVPAPLEGVQAQQAPEGAAKLVAQLDMLLLKAAQASTASLDGQTVQNALQTLAVDGVVSAQWLQSLQDAADTAAANLKALDKFTGRDLAKAFDAGGPFNTTLDAEGNFNRGATKAGKAVLLAVRAQEEVSCALAWLSKKLDRLGGQASPEAAALRSQVDEFRQLCDRRATEINRLAIQMREFAVHLAAHGRNEDPSVVAILDAKVEELLPRQALAMHGTVDALASVDAEVAAGLRPLAERIDAFRANPAATLDSQEFAALQGDIQTMKSALASVREHGVKAAGDRDGRRMAVPKDIVEALEQTLARVERHFETARREVMAKACAKQLDTAKSLLVLDRAYETRCAGSDATLRSLLARRDETLAIMQEICDAAADLSKPVAAPTSPSTARPSSRAGRPTTRPSLPPSSKPCLPQKPKRPSPPSCTRPCGPTSPRP